MVSQYKPLYITSNVLALKFTLLQCKCPSKLRHSEILDGIKKAKMCMKMSCQHKEMCGEGSATLGQVTQSLDVFRSWLS